MENLPACQCQTKRTSETESQPYDRLTRGPTRTEAQREAQRRYQQAHSAEIYERRRQSGLYKRSYLKVYAENLEYKERHKAQALARYYYLKEAKALASIEM